MMHFVPNVILNKKNEYELLIIGCWRILTSQKGYLDDVLRLRVVSWTKTRNKTAHAMLRGIAIKTMPENGIRSYVHFCWGPPAPLERCNSLLHLY